jgi:hypothetical protein
MNSQVFSFGVIFVGRQRFKIIHGIRRRDYYLVQAGIDERYSVVSICLNPALIGAPG